MRPACSRSLLAFVGLVALAACGGDALSPRNVAGTYTLRTVNGQPLPYRRILEATDTIETLASSFTLAPGGAFTERWTSRVTGRGRVATASNAIPGTWRLEGRTVEVLQEGGGGTGGPLTDDYTITVTRDGYGVMVYRK